MARLEDEVNRLADALDGLAEPLRLAYTYIRSDPGGSLTKSRLVLERIVVDLYRQEMGRHPKKPLLGDLLADNQFTRQLERRVVVTMEPEQHWHVFRPSYARVAEPAWGGQVVGGASGGEG